MNLVELKDKLESINVPAEYYSLNDGLFPDRLILECISSKKWIVYYFGERGLRHREMSFLTEEEACNYIYRIFLEQKDLKLF